MSGYIEGAERSQTTLFPDRLKDWTDEDNPVRVIELFVEEIDLEEMGFLRTAPSRTGRPSYHPSVLLKLFHLRLSEPRSLQPCAGAGGWSQC